MGLSEFSNKLVKTYSGGMIRRLEIAQSTLHRPRVLFLDEPTVGLDPVARLTVWEQVRQLQGRFRSAILLTTHYLEEAEEFCHPVAIMNRRGGHARGTQGGRRTRRDFRRRVRTFHQRGCAPARSLRWNLPNPSVSPPAWLTGTPSRLARRGGGASPRSSTCRSRRWRLPYARHPAGAVAADLRAGHEPCARHRHGGPAVSGLPDARHSGAKRAFHRDLQRHFDHLGADLGIVHKFLASPAPRVSLVLGKALGGGVRALVQAVVVLVLSAAIGVHIRTDPAAFVGLAIFVVIGAAVFSSFSLIVACLVTTRERFMGVGQLLTMPLFFASNALYPTSMMPRALRVVSALKPLTYQVDALRMLLLPGFNAAARFALATDLTVLLGALALMAAISAHLYAHIAQ